MVDTLPPPEITSGVAVDYVEQRFSLASDYAQTLWGIAQNLLNQLAAITVDWSFTPTILDPAPMFGLDGINPQLPTEPNLNNVTVVDPGFPYAAPSPVETVLPTRTPPGYTVAEPGFNIPDAPAIVWPTFSETAPTPGAPDIPVAPTINLPPVPTLQGVSIPAPPEYSIPEYDWTLPVDTSGEFTTQFEYNEEAYTSPVATLLAQKLYDNLATGGSGLAPATEQAIYDRATSRQLDEEQSAYDRILNAFAGYGYTLPPGALAAELLEINNKILKTREDLNNDILIQQSKLAQENTHFIIKSSIDSEQSLMSHFNMVKNRALESAKFVVTAAIEIYKTKVEKYKASLAAYQTLAEVYRARIQGEIAKAEFYKAQIEGLVASVQIQKVMIDAYVAQVAATRLYIELYNAQMEGAKIKAEVDKLQIESYVARVQAYAAQVNAATARYQGYEAQIRGEAVKAEVFKAQVQAYGVQVEAYKSTIEADTMILKQNIAANENRVEIFKAQLQEYLAKVQAAVSQGEISAKNEGLKVDLFKAETTSFASQIDALAKAYIGKVEESKARAEIAQKEADTILRGALGKQELIQGNIKAAAQIASQMAAAAISGVSASANIGFSESRADSRSLTNQNIAQDSNHEQVSVATIHQYNYSE